MPSKGHKIAAKQSKLNSRRRRAKSQRKGSSTDETFSAPNPNINNDQTKEVQQIETNKPTLQKEASIQALPAKSSPVNKKPSSVDVLNSNFLAGELRQIGFLSVLMAIILAALTFVLN